MGAVYLAGPRRSGVPAERRGEAPQGGHGQRRHRPPVSYRSPDPGRPRPSPHRQAARRRHLRGRSAVLRHGIRRRRAGRSLLRRPQARHRRAARALLRRLFRGALRAPEPGGSPRPQTEQHPGHRRRDSQAAGLRHRQAAGPGAPGRRGAPDGDGAAADDPGIRQPGAGPGRGDHHRDRRLLPGGGALPSADRSLALPPRRRIWCG